MIKVPPDFHSGYVAVVGLPNVGKSTLLNTLLETKLSIVSSKPQTTRDSILGILNGKNYQAVFVDTPGWLQPKDHLQKEMKQRIVKSIREEIDLVVWVHMKDQKAASADEFWELLQKSDKPILVVLNKIDQIPDRETFVKEWINSATQRWSGTKTFFAISAQTGQGVPDLKKAIESLLPPGPPYFPTDQITNRWERFYVGELIRERLFEIFSQEVPHASLVRVTDFRENKGKKDVIRVVVWVETEGQKRILIGKKGEMVRRLGSESRKEIEARLGRPVFLEIVVKVKKNWRNDSEFIRKNQDISG